MNTASNQIQRWEAGSPLPTVPIELAQQSRHILVVDDDSGIRKMLTRILHGAGYRVSCAEDGLAAWEAICAETFDALITDHDMPRLTGVDLLRRVRAVSREIPVILISGRMPEHEADLPRLLSPGLALEKPFSLDAFMAGIQSVLPSDVLRPDFGRA